MTPSNRINFGLGATGTGTASGPYAPPAGKGVVDPKQAGIFGATTQTSTQTSEPLQWMQPYMQDYMQRAMGVANQGYTASPSQYVGPNQTMQQGWQAIMNRAMGGSPVMNAANTQLTNTINGRNLNGNPQLNAQIKAAQGDVVNAWNNVQKPAWETAMAGSGSYGNTGGMQAYGNAASDLQKNLGRISSDMRFNNYNMERANQMNATSMAPGFANQDYVDANALMGVGAQQQGFNQGQANQNYQWWQEAQNFPRQQLDLYGRAIGAMNGGTQTTTQTPGPSQAGSIAGGALTGMGIYGMGRNYGWW